MHILRRIVFYGLLVLIALAPLPFGSNRPWAWSILSLWVGVLVLLDAVAAGFDPVRGESRFMRRIALPLLLFLPVIIWIILQATPDIFTNIAHPIWSEVSAQLGQLLPSYVTICPEMTWDALMVLLTYAGVFWLAARHGRDRKNASVMLKFFVIVSTCFAIYGLAVYFGRWETVLWYDKTSYLGDLTSTFINRNSYATYAGLGVTSSIAIVVSAFARRLDVATDRRALSRQISNWMSASVWLPVLATITNATALMLTNSRAGFVSAIVGLVTVMVCLFIGRILPRTIATRSVVAIISLLIAGFWLSGDVLEERFETAGRDQVVRLTVYSQVVSGIERSPIAGYGYGVFESGFRQFKRPEIARVNWDLAHNTYLEFGFGTGLAALMLILGTFVAFFVQNLRGIVIRSRGQIYPVLGVSSCLIVAAHSFTDFSVQIPAMGISFVFLFALGWSQCWSSRSEKFQGQSARP